MAKRKNVSDRKVEAVEETHETIWRSAIVAATTTMPLCAPAIRGMHLVFVDEDHPQIKTMAVDKHFRCYVNPKFLDMCRELAAEVSSTNPCTACGAEKHHPIAYIGGVICHEAWHLLRTHLPRGFAHDVFSSNWLAYLWNVATDMEINDGLIEVFQNAPKVPNKLCLPPIQTEKDKSVNKNGVLLPQSEGFDDNKLAEEYFFLLKDKAEEMGEGEGGQGQPGEESECGNCGGTGIEPGTEGDGEGESDGEGKGEGKEGGIGSGRNGPQACGECNGSGKSIDKIFGEADCGSGVDGIERSYEVGEPGPDNPFSGLSDIEARMVRKEVAKQIRDAAKNRGNVPGGWKLWADEELGVPKYDWRTELRKVLSRSLHTIPGDSHRSYKRLSRRCASLGHKVILPSTHDTSPQVAIVQDTSGSMGTDNMVTALEETKGLLKAVQASVAYFNCDAAVDKAQIVHDVRRIDLHGGGGTDMRVGIKAAMEHKPAPDVIVLFTDGWTPWPDTPLPRGKQLVVCLVGRSACESNQVPAWCRVVKIVDDEVEVDGARA